MLNQCSKRYTAIFLLTFCNPLHSQESIRQPVPDKTALTKSMEVIRETYQAHYQTLQTDEERTAYARKLIRDAMATRGNPADRYSLLRVAKEMASSVGNVTTAYSAINQLEKNFQIDSLAWKTSTLEKTARNSREIDYEMQTFLMLQLAEQAIREDRYELAKQITQAAQSPAESTKISDIIDQVADAQQKANDLQAAFVDLKSDRETLRLKPADTAANLSVGRFLFFAKRDWKRGASLLARGADPEVRQLGTMETAESPDELSVGDHWWEAAKLLPVNDQITAKERAADWYRRALPKLEGLQRSRVETRLMELPSKQARHIVHFLDDSWRNVVHSKSARSDLGLLVIHPQSGVGLKHFYREIQTVKIRGRIRSPGKTNLRFQVGPVYGILNWEHGGNLFQALEVAPFGKAKHIPRSRPRTHVKPASLASGKIHNITINRNRSGKIVVAVDGKAIYSRKVDFFGTVNLFAARNVLEIESLTVIGTLDAVKTARGWSHH